MPHPGRLIAQAVLTTGRVIQTATRKVLASGGGHRRLQQDALVVPRGLLEHPTQALAPAALGFATRVGLLVLQRDTAAVGQILDGGGEIEVLLLLHEAEEVAAGAAAEAVEELLHRIH